MAFTSTPVSNSLFKAGRWASFFPNVIWENLHDTHCNKAALNYVWSPLMGRSLFAKCDLINYPVCFLWQIERHSPLLALHILLIRRDKIDFRPEKKKISFQESTFVWKIKLIPVNRTFQFRAVVSIKHNHKRFLHQELLHNWILKVTFLR